MNEKVSYLSNPKMKAARCSRNVVKFLPYYMVSIPEYSKLPGLHALRTVLNVGIKKRYLMYMLSLILTAHVAKVLHTFFQSLQANGWAAIAQSV